MRKKPDSLEKMAFRLKSQFRKGDQTEFDYILKGNRKQQRAQVEFLKANGLKIGYSNIRPGLATEEDFKTALRLMWYNRQIVKGWWRYPDEMTQYNICTPEEISAARQELFEGPLEKFFRKLFGRWFK